MTKSADLPEGWVPIDLSEVGELHCGQSPSRAEVNHDGVGTPYVTGPEQWNGHRIEENKWTTNPKRVVPGGCIFITVKGAGVGKLFPGIECAIGRDVYAYKPHSEIPTNFVRLALKHSIEDLKRQAAGDIPGLSKRHIMDHPIGLPPLNEQRRIVAKIEELTARSQAAKQALDAIPPLLERFRQSVLAAAFRGDLTKQWRQQNPNTEPASELLKRIRQERRHRWEQDYLTQQIAKGKTPRDDKWKEKYQEPEPFDTTGLPALPEGWCWVSVEDVGSVQLGRQRAPQHHQGANMRPYLRVANVFEARIDTSDIMEMNFDESEFETFELRYGDILLNEGQSKHLVGRAAIYRDEVPGACFQNTLVRYRTAPALLPEFALLIFRHYLHSGRFQQIAKWTTSMAHLGAGRFAKVEFPLPPLSEQRQIVSAAEDLLSMGSVTERQTAHCEARIYKLNQSILAKAFRGELVPQDPNDEPASALLGRIRAEREATPRENGKKRKGRGK